MIPTQEQIEQLVADLNAVTQREMIRIKLSLSDSLALTDSKFGGMPYVPKGGSLPTSAEGKPLFMLAQINCEQLPENNIYPKKGLLQFWIADTEDYLFGLDFDNPCSNDFKRVLYYPTIDEALSIDDFIEDYVFDNDNLTFSLDENSAQKLFIEKWNETFSDKIEYLYQLPNEADFIRDLDSTGHKIGGYPYFTQDDPRKDNDPHTLLLLQIDSDDIEDVEIIWGDCGVANFFINPEDLAKCQFDDVMYNWDCT